MYEKLHYRVKVLRAASQFGEVLELNLAACSL